VGWRERGGHTSQAMSTTTNAQGLSIVTRLSADNDSDSIFINTQRLLSTSYQETLGVTMVMSLCLQRYRTGVHKGQLPMASES
jgi:hypothetical protein